MTVSQVKCAEPECGDLPVEQFLVKAANKMTHNNYEIKNRSGVLTFLCGVLVCGIH